jgi:hypothetical protein
MFWHNPLQKEQHNWLFWLRNQAFYLPLGFLWVDLKVGVDFRFSFLIVQCFDYSKAR